jgi:hypothetical protein
MSKSEYIFEVQTRDVAGGTTTHPTLEEALLRAAGDKTIWKISFPLPTGERFRMILSDSQWVMDLIDIKKIKEELHIME